MIENLIEDLIRTILLCICIMGVYVVGTVMFYTLVSVLIKYGYLVRKYDHVNKQIILKWGVM